jgi:hypothetical protein
LNRRVFIVLSVAVAFAFADFLATGLTYRPELDLAGMYLGPVKIRSVSLEYSELYGHPRPAPSGGSSEIKLGWRTAENQKNFGDARVTAIWNTGQRASWITTDKACGYIFEHFGPADEATPRPGFSNASSPGGHRCYARSIRDGHEFFYDFEVLPPRCNTRGLVVALINSREKDAPSVLGFTELLPDARCQAEMRTFGSVSVSIPFLLLGVAAVMMRFVWRRSSAMARWTI